MSRGAPLALLALLPAALWAQQPSTHSLTGNSVAIYNLVGEATIQGGSGSGVSVQVTRVGGDGAKLRVEQEEIRGRATLLVVYPEDRIVYPALGRGSNSHFSVREDGTWGGDDGHGRGSRSRQISVRGDGDGLEAAANLRITVPAGKRVAVYVGVGRVEVSNVDGDLLVDVASADIVARGTRGTLHLDTGSGNLRLERAEGSTSLDTGSGEVEIAGYRNGTLNIDTGSGSVNASDLDVRELEIDTGSGDIVLEGVTTPRLSLDTGSGSIRATLRTSPEMAHVETGSGDVTLRMPESVDATIDLETGSGDFTVDFPMQLIGKDDSSIRGRIGAGKGRISIETGSGDIRLMR